MKEGSSYRFQKKCPACSADMFDGEECDCGYEDYEFHDRPSVAAIIGIIIILGAAIGLSFHAFWQLVIWLIIPFNA